jgi:hypothetical protein
MKKLTPVQAIRKNCLDCSGGSTKEVKNCHIKDCVIYPFRLGTNPNYSKGDSKPQPNQDNSKNTENS